MEEKKGNEKNITEKSVESSTTSTKLSTGNTVPKEEEKGTAKPEDLSRVVSTVEAPKILVDKKEATTEVNSGADKREERKLDSLDDKIDKRIGERKEQEDNKKEEKSIEESKAEETLGQSISPVAIPDLIPKQTSNETVEEQILKNFIVIDKGEVSSEISASSKEVLVFFQVHKELFVSIEEYNKTRKAKTSVARALLDGTCERTCATMKRLNLQNKYLTNYFGGITINLRNTAKHMQKALAIQNSPSISESVPSELKSVHTFFKEAGSTYSQAFEELANFIESDTIPTINDLSATYNKSIQAQKEVFPKQSRAIDSLEDNIDKLFENYKNAYIMKEKGVLSGKPNSLDLWFPLNAYLKEVTKQMDCLRAYTQFVNNLFEDKQNAEKNRLTSTKKCFEKYLQRRKVLIGDHELYESVYKFLCKDTSQMETEDVIFKETPVKKEGETKMRIEIRKLKVPEIKALIKEQIAGFPMIPTNSLEEAKFGARRLSGLLSSYVPCTLMITKDNFLHLFENDGDEKTLYSFNLKKTTSKFVDPEHRTLEVAESRRASFLDIIYNPSVFTIRLDSPEKANELKKRINEIS